MHEATYHIQQFYIITGGASTLDICRVEVMMCRGMGLWCVKAIPSQRTLRDYTHYVPATIGLSVRCLWILLTYIAIYNAVHVVIMTKMHKSCAHLTTYICDAPVERDAYQEGEGLSSMHNMSFHLHILQALFMTSIVVSLWDLHQ